MGCETRLTSEERNKWNNRKKLEKADRLIVLVGKVGDNSTVALKSGQDRDASLSLPINERQ